MDNLTIYMLLLLAVGSGWILAMFSLRNKRRKRHGRDIFDDYFVGLNYLLNDEPDEALDTFIKALELNSETVETHLALGALLRRRGKVDKAIKVHQLLLARPGLESDFADSTRLQLAIDYIRAGLLDRAERLLNEILNEDSPAKWDALRHLITIYQTEKEWEDAISCSSRLLSNSAYKRDGEIRVAAANYCCELADQFLAQEQIGKAKEQARRAFTFDRKSIRASLLLAKIEQLFGNYKAAVRELVRIRKHNPAFTASLLGQLENCYRQMQAPDDYEKLLTDFFSQNQDSAVLLELAKYKKQRYGEDAALHFLQSHSQLAPSLPAIVEILGLQLPAADTEVQANLKRLRDMISQLQQRKAAYQCNHCGYESRSLYWLCPGCQKWDKIRPLPTARI